MSKKIFNIDHSVSMEIERKYYIMKSYESLMAVICRNFYETPTDDYRNMIEDYRKLYQKAQIDFSCSVDSLFYVLIECPPSYYKFNFDKNEVECEW